MPRGIFIRTKEHLEKMKRYQFKKGHIPWCAGKKMVPDRTLFCIDCNKKLGKNSFYNGSKRCIPCYKNHCTGMNHPMYGKKHTKEAIDKMTKASSGIFGKESRHWQGGKIKDSRGYVLIYKPDHPFSSNNYVREHRLVIEEKIGRYLLRSEISHHLGKKDDNHPQMLMAFVNQSAHKRFEKSKEVNSNEIVFDGREI